MVLVAPDHIESGSGRLIAKVSAADQGAISGKYLFSPGDTLYSKIRPYLRKAVLAEFGGLTSADMYPLRPTVEVEPRLLLAILLGEHFSRFAEIVSMRSGFPKINREEFAEYSVALPRLAEQRRITEILDALDEAIRKTEELIAKLKQVKQGLLHDLLTRGIDDNGELRDPERCPEQFKDSLIGRIPRSWEVVPLQELYAESARNGLYKPPQFHGRGSLMVQMGDIFRGLAVSFDGASRVEVTPSEFATYGLRQGDLLFGRRSLVMEGAGKCALVVGMTEASTFESSIVRVRIKSDRVAPLFVAHFLTGDAGYRDRRRFIRQVAVSGVSSRDISEFVIAVPPRFEQDCICARIAALDVRLATESAGADKLRVLKHGVTGDLLTGRVRTNDLRTEAVA